MNNFLEKEVDDLRIVQYLNEEKLPSFLNDVLQVAQTDVERDILLVAAFTAVSACLPNRYFRYGTTGKRYFANLQTFVMAGAASGKGIANEALELVQPIHEQQPLLVPGDSTYAAFFQTLLEQNGVGYMHESEGSVITDVWRTGTASYNTALRKAAEHETISRRRVGRSMQFIDSPRLSCLLTGTFDQFRALVPSVENGFFSRLTLLVIRNQEAFRPDVFRTATDEADRSSRTLLRQCQQQLQATYEHLFLDQMREFCLTPQQAELAGTYFQEQHKTLLQELGAAFHPTVVRMGVMLVRVAMILSLMRNREALVCTDDDFHSALLICSKLLLHAADAFQQIEGDKTVEVAPESKHLQRQSFFAILPSQFTTAMCDEQSRVIGICPRTAGRYLEKWLAEGRITKLTHGHYAKCA